MTKGITGTGEGFGLQGRRLGGFSRQPPLSSLRKTALSAAEKRARTGSLLPTGPKRLGGDSSIMADLSPVQAAAMAAERRLLDDIWCGPQLLGDGESSSDICEDVVYMGESTKGSKISHGLDKVSRKRNRESNNGDGLSLNASTSGSTLNRDTGSRRSSKVSNSLAQELKSCSDSGFENLTGMSSSVSMVKDNSEELAMWECDQCTLLNPVSTSSCYSMLLKNTCYH